MKNMVAWLLTSAIATAGSAPAWGQDRAEATDENGETVIVVTAQKREERLLDTPISIGVLSGQELDRGSARSVSEVLNRVGGVSVSELQPGRTQITVRGVVAGGNFAPTTAFYLDEAPFAFPRSADLPDVTAFDLARIEVLRGPQGTLYGAGSLSGVVRIITNDADVDEFAVTARARASDTDHGDANYGGDLAINVPVIPGSLGIRGVAGYARVGGFIDSTLDGGENINETESENYRLRVTWSPIDNLDIRVGYWRSEIHGNATSLSADNLTTSFTSDRPDERALNIYSLTAEYAWPSFSLLSATNYIDIQNETILEAFSGGGILRFIFAEDQNSFTQEVRLVSDLEGPWQWSAGAFYANTERRSVQDARPSVPRPTLPGVRFITLPGLFVERITNESYAVFGELTRSFADDRVSLTGGLRYYRSRETLQDLGSLTNAPLLPDRSATFDKVTGRLVLNFRPSADMLLYGSVATGFRNGAIQGASALAVDRTLPDVDPDSVINYEIGAKGTAFNRTLTYEGAVYYLDWQDIQQQLVVASPAAPGGVNARVNAGSASGFGVDARLSYRPSREINLWGSLGWSDLRLDETIFSISGGRRRELLVKGDRPNDSPEWTAAAGLDFLMPTWLNDVDFALSGSLAYGSQRVARALIAGVLSTTTSDAFTQVRLGAGLRGTNWNLELFADNLLNEHAAIVPRDPLRRFEAVRQRPRTVGIQLTFTR